MFGIADYGAFVVAIIVFLAIPGPGNLAIITSTGKGRRPWRIGGRFRGDRR
jgi:leucine efflux protein